MGKNQAIETLIGLLDVQPSTSKETKEFNSIDHEDLVKALVYWIDQCKTLFGEPTTVKSFHGIKEEGIDIATDIWISTQMRFGAQVKSYKDIEKPHFASEVHAQISRSHKHNLSKLILSFAGDMNDKSQNAKVSGMISEIHQNKGDNNYILTILPEQLLTIYRAYKAQEHPLKFVMLDYEGASKLADALTQSLSNDRRKAKVSIHIEYTNVEKDKAPIEIKVRYKLNKDEASLLDRIEHLPITGGSIKIEKDKLEKSQVYENGKPLFGEDIISDLTIIREEIHVPLIIETILDDGSVAKSLGCLDFVVKEENDGKPYYEFFDKSHPLSIKIFPNHNEVSTNSFSFDLDLSRGHAVLLLSVIEFLQSVNNVKTLKITNVNSRKESLANKKSDKLFEFEAGLISLVSSLAFIQCKTGQIVRYPENPEGFTPQEFYHVFAVADYIKKGQIPINSINATLSLSRIQALLLVEEYEKHHELKNIEKREPMVIQRILGQDIKLGPAQIIANKARPVGDISKIREHLINTNDEMVSLDIESFGDNKPEMKLLWFPQHN